MSGNDKPAWSGVAAIGNRIYVFAGATEDGWKFCRDYPRSAGVAEIVEEGQKIESDC